MSNRMDKYKNDDKTVNKNKIPTRSDKNKVLYRQIYNAYDEFENLVIPSNAREIDINDLKKEITSRQEYREKKDHDEIVGNNNKTAKSEKVNASIKEDEIYDINELLTKAVSGQKGPNLIEPTLSNGDYLKKLKLDNHKTNIEQVKEMYEDIQEESQEEDESLLKTANLSLEILSDLKGDGDVTMVSAPIKDEEIPEDDKDLDFYSNNYKFSKKDFERKEKEVDSNDEDEEEEEERGNGKFFFKILLLVFGILLMVIVLIYFINLFNKI